MRAQNRWIVTAVVVAWACAPTGEDAAREARPSQGTLTVGDAELKWVREGEGPAVFVLGSSVYYPKAYSAGLREHFEMVFLDGRHFVPDYAPGREALAEIDLTTFADDVEAARIELGYGSITVVGHSVHGQIALEYADRYPQATSRVVLIGPVPYSLSEFSDGADAIWQQLASPARKALMAERLATIDAVLADAPPNRRFAVGYRHRGPLYWADPEYDAEWVLEGLEDGPAFARLTGTLPSRDEARARLERIQAPILLVLGKLDFVIPYTAWEELTDGLENLDYVLLENESHNPQTESPERFDPVLIEWMAGR